MKRIKTIFFFALISVIMSSCGPRVISTAIEERPTTAYNQNISVVELGEAVPEGYTKVGQVYAGDSGVTMKCNYPFMMQKINEECRKMGGTLIRIVEHKRPDLWSSCHRITADIYAEK